MGYCCLRSTSFSCHDLFPRFYHCPLTRPHSIIMSIFIHKRDVSLDRGSQGVKQARVRVPGNRVCLVLRWPDEAQRLAGSAVPRGEKGREGAWPAPSPGCYFGYKGTPSPPLTSLQCPPPPPRHFSHRLGTYRLRPTHTIQECSHSFGLTLAEWGSQSLFDWSPARRYSV